MTLLPTKYFPLCRTLLLTVFLSLLTTVSFATTLNAEEKSVLQDWEQIQKTYPQTDDFSKIGEQEYHLSNRGMEYDGKVMVDNVLIDTDSEFDTQSAEIYVTLDKSEEDFYNENNKSYMRWVQSNHLYYDTETQTWITYEDFIDKVYASDYADYGECSASDSYDSENVASNESGNVIKNLIVSFFPVFLIIITFWLLYYYSPKFLGKKVRSQYQMLEEAIESNKQIIASNERLVKELSQLSKVLSDKHTDESKNSTSE